MLCYICRVLGDINRFAKVREVKEAMIPGVILSFREVLLDI